MDRFLEPDSLAAKNLVTHHNPSYLSSLGQSSGKSGRGELGIDLGRGVGLFHHLRAGAMWDGELELGQAESLELDGLSGHTNGSSIDEGSVLVDHIDDGDQLASKIAEVNQGDTTR